MRSLISQMSKSSGNSKVHKGKGVLGRCGAVITGLLCAGLLGGTASAQVQTCADGLLYYNYSDAIYTYDPTTNFTQKLTVSPTGTPIGDITFGTDGTLYGVAFNTDTSPELYTFDAKTGVISSGKPINVSPTSGDFKYANALGTLVDGRLLVGFSGQPAFYSQYGGIYTRNTSTIWQFNPNTTASSYTATAWVTLPAPPTGGQYVHTTGDIVQIGNYVYVATLADNGAAYLYKIQVDASNNPVGTPTALRMYFPDGTPVPDEGIVGLSTLNGQLYAINGNGDNRVFLVDQNTGRLSLEGTDQVPSGSYVGAGMTQRITSNCAPVPTVTDLKITKSASVATAKPGDTVTYTLNMTNLGPTQLTQAQASGTITVTDTLPAGTTLASIPVKASNVTYSDWDCSASVIGSNVVQCTTKMGTWPVNYVNGIQYQVKIGSAASGTLINTAQLNYSADTNFSNNTAQATITTPVPKPPTVEVKKVVKGRVSSTDQFSVLVQNTAGTTLATGTTSGTGTTATTGIYTGTAGTTYRLTETGSAGTSLSGYDQTMSCTNSAIGSTTVLPTVVGGTITPQANDVITCTITNTPKPKPPTLEVKKIVNGRVSSTDQFSVFIQDPYGTAVATGTTSGTGTTATTGTYIATAGTTYRLNEAGSAGTSLSGYNQTMSCVNSNTSSTTALPTTVGGSITPQGNDVITCTITNSPKPPVPAICQNLYSLVITTQLSDGTAAAGRIQRLNETNNTLVSGTSINLPTYVSSYNGYTYQVTSAATAISPDGTKFYIASDYVNGVRYLYTYDTATGRWTRGSAFSGASDAKRIIRMGVTPDGTGYAMDINGNLWSFTPSGTTTYLGKPTRTSSSGTAPEFYENGDMYSTADGKLYLLSSVTGGAVTLWYLDPKAMKAEYLGVIGDAETGVQYNGLAAIPSGVFADSTGGHLYEIDPKTLDYRLVSSYSDGYGSTDLASCYYEDRAPQVNAVKSVQKVSGSAGSEVRPGDTLEYTIVVSNTGNLPAGGAVFRDPLPSGTTYVPGSATVNGFNSTVLNGTSLNLSGSAYPFTNPVGICSKTSTACTDQILKVDTTPGTIDNEAVIKFRVTVNSGVTSVSNVGVVNYNDGGTPPTDIPTNPVVTPITPPVQLTIAKTSNAANGTWTVGQSGANYTLTVTNSGSVATNGVITVKDLLPAGLTYNGAATAPSGWTCSVSGQILTCTTSNVLAAGSSVNITVPVNVVSTGTLTNKAVVGGGGDPDAIPDPATCTPGSTNPQNQCASVPVTVGGSPALNVTKTVKKVSGSTGTAVYPGDILEYTIQVRNTGTVDATGVTFKDLLPNGTTYVADSAKINGFNVTITNGTPISLSGAAYPFASAVGICSTSSAACSTQTIKVDTTPATLDNEAIIVFRVKVADPFTLTPSQVSNQAVVTYPGGPTGGTPSDDPTTTTPNDPTITPVVKPAKLTAVKTVQNITAGTAPSTTGEGKPGDTLEYCITTTNEGSANATKITFGDTVPSNTNFLYAGYGANQDIKMTTSSGKISYFTAPLDADYGSLNNGRVMVSDPNFVLTPQQSFTVCFRATIK